MLLMAAQVCKSAPVPLFADVYMIFFLDTTAWRMINVGTFIIYIYDRWNGYESCVKRHRSSKCKILKGDGNTFMQFLIHSDTLFDTIQWRLVVELVYILRSNQGKDDVINQNWLEGVAGS